MGAVFGVSFRYILRISGEQGGRRGKREASAKRELRAREVCYESPHARNSRFALASLSPLFAKKSRLFCRLGVS